jgi:GAF domain-containing protein
MNRQTAVTSLPSPSFWRRRATQFATAGILAGILFPVLASISKLVGLHQSASMAAMLAMQQAEPVLWITDTAPLFLGLVAGLAGQQQDRLMQANSALRQREAEINAARSNLEANVLERTRELDERNAQMRSVVSLARQVAEVQDLAPLLQMAVDIIHERFGQYDANLYLLDERGQAAFLRASSSTAGRALASNGHRVGLGDQGPVGRVARRGKMLTSVVRGQAGDQPARTSGASALTSQVTLPLIVRGRVIGVLDLLLPSPQPVSQNDLDVLQLAADQLAAAIESVRQASESRATVQQLETITAEGTRVAWQQYLRNNSMAYRFTPSGVHPIPAVGPADTQDAGMMAAPAVPLLLRGQRIGGISLRTRNGTLTPSERDLLEKVAAQVALALENVRLLEETRQRAAQEQIISEISARFSRSLDVDALLQAAVREFAALPDVAEATVMLKPADDHSSQVPN